MHHFTSSVIQDDMNRRSNAIQRLRDAGLYVVLWNPNSYTISRYQDPIPFPDSLSLKSLKSPRTTDDCANECPWMFRHWKMIPGPGPDDFDCECATLEAAVEAILAFYFGQPTILDNWLVPLHVHPELLSEDHVRAALSQATAITKNQFEIIQEERDDFFLREVMKAGAPRREWWREVTAVLADELVGTEDFMEQLRIVCELENAGRKLPPRPPLTIGSLYEWAFQSQFLCIQHVKETTKTLRLRRDLQAVYIVVP